MNEEDTEKIKRLIYYYEYDIIERKNYIFNQKKNIQKKKFSKSDYFDYFNKLKKYDFEYLQNLLSLKAEVTNSLEHLLQEFQLKKTTKLEMMQEKAYLIDIQGFENLLESIDEKLEKAVIESKNIFTRIIMFFVNFTNREREIIELCFKNLKEIEIANFLHITKQTVAKHVENIMGKIIDNKDLLIFFENEIDDFDYRKEENKDILLNSKNLKKILNLKFDYTNPKYISLYQKGKSIYYDKIENEVKNGN